MTHAGARGGTAAEIAGVLGMPDDREQLAAAVESLRSTFKIAKGQFVTLERANRLWVQRGKPLDPAFTTLLQERHNAAPGEVDFAGAAEAARAEVNKWVSDNTEGRPSRLTRVRRGPSRSCSVEARWRKCRSCIAQAGSPPAR